MITAFGDDDTAAVTHYLNYGYDEGRTVSFDATTYLANYSDLQEAFGSDLEEAKQHYINYGHNEGRVDV